MLKFESFCKSNGRYTELLLNSGAKEIYSYISKPESVVKMIEASRLGLPAITSLAEELEIKHGSYKEFKLSNAKNRQTVGRMMKYVLSLFGYSKASDKNERLRKFSKSTLFKTGLVYKEDENINKIYTIDYKVKKVEG